MGTNMIGLFRLPKSGSLVPLLTPRLPTVSFSQTLLRSFESVCGGGVATVMTVLGEYRLKMGHPMFQGLKCLLQGVKQSKCRFKALIVDFFDS
jgi:hypothetical protein